LLLSSPGLTSTTSTTPARRWRQWPPAFWRASPSPERIADLRAALAALEAGPVADWAEMARLDLQMHEALVPSANNAWLVRMFNTVAAETRLCMIALEPFYPARADGRRTCRHRVRHLPR
jgi:DNA-binding GntR family transcriptional regulator